MNKLLFLLLFISCRQSPKPVLHMMEDTTQVFADTCHPHLVFKEMEDSCKPFQRIVDGVVRDTIYPCAQSGYSWPSGHGQTYSKAQYDRGVGYTVNDSMDRPSPDNPGGNMRPSPEAAARMSKELMKFLKPIKTKYHKTFPGPGYVADSIRKASLGTIK